MITNHSLFSHAPITLNGCQTDRRTNWWRNKSM